ncbi:arginine/ornithine antiporter [Niallia circulans]|uniref:amino acid permease n=1 Tax=Niallia circulans TaxID=1397 RepID=UPI00077C7844|nr:amino acid permease [Niallia circulans]MDR4314962.1 amino acid permease [Niallia circulans]MED3837721.1 amino acid permease [Niallia circulans]MED4243133.1 amino acid permease [Niallia circulans]MED4247112.1 amino acid permease [Niallia circulans]QKH61685.1 amino acid permease [Niallia circulans]
MNTKGKLGLGILISLVVGNMVGSGIFMLPRSLAEVASPAGVILAWLLTGFGVLVTALVFGNLAIRKPKLTGGPQIYAKELFKRGSKKSTLSGFMSTWGYWIGNLAGNVAIITTFAGYLSTFFPILTSEAALFHVGSFTLYVGNALTFLVCTILLWGTHWIILNGLENAGKLNILATSAKVIGFMLFIIIALFAFETSNILPFAEPKVNAAGHSVGLFGQINSAAITTLWAFIGVESAVVFASRAKKQADVKKATIIGLLIALAIYIGISTLVMGILSQNELIASQKPLIDAIEAVLGPIAGKILAAIGLISLFGSTIGWIMLSAEVPYAAAKQGIFIPAFLKENKKGIPTFSLVVTNILGQLFIFSTVSRSISQAFDFIIYIATLSYLVPYLISSIFQLKLVISGETYTSMKSRKVDFAIGIIATIYSIWVIIAGTADIKTFSFGVLLLLSGILFYNQLNKGAKPE